EMTARGDVDFGSGRRLETSGLVSRDAHVWQLSSGPSGQGWGNVAGRVTFRAPVGALAISHTLGVSHFASHADRWFAQPAIDTAKTFSGVENLPVTSSVDYLTLGGRVSAKTPARDPVIVGYDLVAQRSSFGGPREAIYWGDLTTDHASRRDGLA